MREYRAARSRIGLVPQELTTDMFETVIATVRYSRELFGVGPNPAYLEKLLHDLSLWERRADLIMTLSGGMKRRVMIAKALATSRRSCSSTSRLPASTWSCAATCGRGARRFASRASRSS